MRKTLGTLRSSYARVLQSFYIFLTDINTDTGITRHIHETRVYKKRRVYSLFFNV